MTSIFFFSKRACHGKMPTPFFLQKKYVLKYLLRAFFCSFGMGECLPQFFLKNPKIFFAFFLGQFWYGILPTTKFLQKK